MFVIRVTNGEEVQGCEGDDLTINQETGVLTVSRVDGFEEITTHYSSSAWQSVTQRERGQGVQPSLWFPRHADPTVDAQRTPIEFTIIAPYRRDQRGCDQRFFR
jgi:hypothetical protein